MKLLSYLVALLLLFNVPLILYGCGADLDNPSVYEDTEDSPEELATLEEIEAELEELEAEDAEDF